MLDIVFRLSVGIHGNGLLRILSAEVEGRFVVEETTVAEGKGVTWHRGHDAGQEQAAHVRHMIQPPCIARELDHQAATRMRCLLYIRHDKRQHSRHGYSYRSCEYGIV